MRRVTIVVIGNGKSTRANVEALISDVADSSDEVTIATVYGSKQSEGQVWAEQWAQDKEIPVLQYPDNNYDSLFAETAMNEIQFFMLWDDEDSECQLAASKAQEFAVRMYDLTEGLTLIGMPSMAIIPKPAQAPAHDIVEEAPALITVEEVLAAQEDPEDESDLVINLDETIQEVLNELADLLAEKIVAEVTRKLSK